MTDFSCFTDKVALVTGAGGALGGGTAGEFAKYGANLALIDNDQGRLDNIVAALIDRGQPKEKIVALCGDVTKKGDVEQLISETILRFKTINFVVNIVGHKRMGAVEDCTIEDLDVCLNGSVRATFIVSKLALPYLLETKGCIINMSSVSGMRAYHSALPYGTSKAAVNHMTRIMAAGLAKKGVRVNCVCPATCYSEFNIVSGNLKTKEELDKYLSVSSRAIPFGRVGKVEETTKTILYLCSSDAGFITGAVLPIDGAYTQTLYEPPM